MTTKEELPLSFSLLSLFLSLSLLTWFLCLMQYDFVLQRSGLICGHKGEFFSLQVESHNYCESSGGDFSTAILTRIAITKSNIPEKYFKERAGK